MTFTEYDLVLTDFIHKLKRLMMMVVIKAERIHYSPKQKETVIQAGNTEAKIPSEIL